MSLIVNPPLQLRLSSVYNQLTFLGCPFKSVSNELRKEKEKLKKKKKKTHQEENWISLNSTESAGFSNQKIKASQAKQNKSCKIILQTAFLILYYMLLSISSTYKNRSSYIWDEVNKN